jgi:hypothetical protein
MTKLLVSLLAFVCCFSLAQDDQALTIDRAITSKLLLSFANDKNIQPKASEFDVTNYVLMSNASGERWAVVTLTNMASGARVFEHQQLMALFADGQRTSAGEFKLNFSANETQSFTLAFGENKFPILALYANNQ